MNMISYAGIVGPTAAKRKSPIILGCALFTILLPQSVFAQEWPQLLGPQRDGHSESELDGESWPTKLEPTWQIELGDGYAGPIVKADKVLIPHRQGKQEFLTAISLDSGEKIWDARWTASYRGGLNNDSGPRATCATEGEHVLCYDASGALVCVDFEAGKVLWQRQLRRDYDADDGYFGAGPSPLIFEDLVIACPGGAKAGVVAIEISTGETRWTATQYDASYASPILLQAAGKDRIVAVMRLNTVLLDAQSGKVMDDIRFGSRGPTVNAATPILLNENRVFLTASYGVGLMVLDVVDDKFVKIHQQNNTLSSQYNTPVLIGDRLIGIHGREDVGMADLVALPRDFTSQVEPIWSKPNLGPTHLLALANDRILGLSIDGQLGYYRVDQNECEALATAALVDGTYRALPALVGKKLLARAQTSSGKNMLLMVELD